MKKLTLVFLFVFVLTNISGIQSQSLSSLQEAIAEQLKQKYNTEYLVLFAKSLDQIDSSQVGVINDTFNTIGNKILFLANSTSKENAPTSLGIFGFYDDNILWDSGPMVSPYALAGYEIQRIDDINKDGIVDILVSWFRGNQSQSEEFWIFSWNGSTAEIVSDINSDNTSKLFFRIGTSKFIDINLDGVLEIFAKSQAGEQRLFAWNGSKYTNTETEFSKLPRDGIDVNLNAKISYNQGIFKYSYSLKNQSQSVQSIEDFYLRKHSNSIFDSTTPLEWSFNSKIKYGLLRWHVDPILAYHRESLIKPEMVEDSLGFLSNDLPRTVKFYSQGNNGDLSFNTDDLFENSYSGITLGPWLPDSSMSLQNFNDSLKTFRYRSCSELGWATDTSVCSQLEQQLNEVGYFLSAQDTAQAANALQDFIDLVESEKDANLTSEGYALLYYNAQYLAARLREPEDPETDSGITCGCDNPVTQSSGTINLQNRETKCLNTSFSGSVFFQSGGTLNICSRASLQNIYGNQPGQVNVSESGEVTIGNWNNNYSEDGLTNWGMVTFSNWTTVNNGSLINHGEMNVNGGLNQNSGLITNHGQLDVSNDLNINTSGNSNTGLLSVGGRFTLNSGSFENGCHVQTGSLMVNGKLNNTAGSSVFSGGPLTLNSSGEMVLDGGNAMLSVESAMLNGTVTSSGENLFVAQNSINYNSGAVINSTGALLNVIASNLNALMQDFMIADGSAVVIPVTPCNPQGYNSPGN